MNAAEERSGEKDRVATKELGATEEEMLSNSSNSPLSSRSALALTASMRANLMHLRNGSQQYFAKDA